MKNLRRLIRFLLEKEENKKEELLVEPDEADGREETEASSGGVAGVAVPLGAGPNYPNPTRRTKKTRSPEESARSSFGNSKSFTKK